MKIKKIISGGQTGVDQGALDFALSIGLDCGGWCPNERMCETGRIPSRYPVVEVEEEDYNKRTQKNVIDADGTLIINRDGVMDAGTLLTIDFSDKHRKPFFRIEINEYRDNKEEIKDNLKNWIDSNDIKVLNVAGNRESSNPGIQKETADILKELLVE